VLVLVPDPETFEQHPVVGVAGGVVLLLVAVAVGTGGVIVRVAVGGVPVTVGVGVPCAGCTVRNTALTDPQVWYPWKSLTPLPRTKRMCLPMESGVVSTVACTVTVGEPKLPVIAMAVPPAQGGVSM
jgi:hypothetical protein